MSAFDFTARALALRATALTPLTFAELPQAQLPGNVTRIASSGNSEPGSGAAVYVSDSLADAALQAAHPAAVIRERGGRYFRLAWEEQGYITPEQFGWTEGETNTGQIVTDAFHYQIATGGVGTVELRPRRTYLLANIPNQTVGGSYIYNAGRLFSPPGARLRGNGATLKGTSANGYALVKSVSEVLSTHIVTGPMAAGDKVFQLATVAEAAQFAVGDNVCWRLGDVPIDPPETLNWAWARVAAIDLGTGQITLDRHLRRDWDGTGVNNRHLRRMNPTTGLVLDDINFESVDRSTPLVYGTQAYAGWNASWRQLRGKGCGAGTLVIQYHEGFHVDYIEGSANNFTGSSQGRGLSIAESRGRVDHLEVSDCYRFATFIEYACDVSIGYLHDVVSNGDNGTAGTFRHKGVLANWGCRVHVERALFEGYGNFYTHEATNDSSVTFGVCRVVTAAAPYVVPVPGYNCDRLELCIDGVEELYIGDRARWVEQTIFLTDGMTNVDFPFGYGIVTAAHAVFGGGATAADFTTFNVGRQSHSCSLLTLVPTAPSTGEINIITAYAYSTYVANATAPQFGAGAGNLNWADRAQLAMLRISTPAGAGLAGSGKYVRVRMLMVPNEKAAADTVYTSARIARETQDLVYEGRKATGALNASIAAGATVSETVPASGVAAGDLAEASFSVALGAGLVKTVEAVANGIKVSLTNPTASAIAGPNGILSVQGRKRRLGA